MTSAVCARMPSVTALALTDFEIFQAPDIPGLPQTIIGLTGGVWVDGIPILSAHHNACAFMTPAQFGRYRDLSFMTAPSSVANCLAIAECSAVEGLSFSDQCQMLPDGFRPAAAAEIVRIIFAWHFYSSHGSYPNYRFSRIWCNDVISLDEWPSWWRRFRGIDSDHRVALRIDPIRGVEIEDYAVDSATDTYGRTIVIAAVKMEGR